MIHKMMSGTMMWSMSIGGLLALILIFLIVMALFKYILSGDSF
jgi:predicted RND superfamily exporter protein